MGGIILPIKYMYLLVKSYIVCRSYSACFSVYITCNLFTFIKITIGCINKWRTKKTTKKEIGISTTTEYLHSYYPAWSAMVRTRTICKYIVPRSRNSFICTRENNFLYPSKLCHGEKGMTTHARSTSAIYNSQMSGVKMPGDLHVSMLIVY